MKYIFLLLVCISSLSVAQQKESCNCSQNLKALIAVAQKRYAGFEDKVNPQSKKAYDSILRKLQDRAQKATGWDCSTILEDYVAFFKDKHFSINTNTSTLSARYQAVMAPENMDVVEKKLSEKEPSLPIEGIWQDIEGHYQVAIYKSGNAGQLTGAVLKTDVDQWHRAVIKFRLTPAGKCTYRATYYGRDFKPSIYRASLAGDLLRFSLWGGTWFRSKPRFTDSEVLKRVHQQLSLPNLTFQPIDKDFGYLKISSFSISQTAFDQIVKENREVISRMPYLILDLRGNVGGGGSLDTFGEFLRLERVDN